MGLVSFTEKNVGLWCCIAACMFCNAVCMGLQRGIAILFVEFIFMFQKSASETSLIFSLQTGAMSVACRSNFSILFLPPFHSSPPSFYTSVLFISSILVCFHFSLYTVFFHSSILTSFLHFFSAFFFFAAFLMPSWTISMCFLSLLFLFYFRSFISFFPLYLSLSMSFYFVSLYFVLSLVLRQIYKLCEYSFKKSPVSYYEYQLPPSKVHHLFQPYWHRRSWCLFWASVSWSSWEASLAVWAWPSASSPRVCTCCTSPSVSLAVSVYHGMSRLFSTKFGKTSTYPSSKTFHKLSSMFDWWRDS